MIDKNLHLHSGLRNPNRQFGLVIGFGRSSVFVNLSTNEFRR